jgi:hypothetical protein
MQGLVLLNNQSTLIYHFLQYFDPVALSSNKNSSRSQFPQVFSDSDKAFPSGQLVQNPGTPKHVLQLESQDMQADSWSKKGSS